MHEECIGFLFIDMLMEFHNASENNNTPGLEKIYQRKKEKLSIDFIMNLFKSDFILSNYV